jgi:lysophospholipid acyltransferase (LPLAT)-like uncharacterized protein
MKSSRLVVPNAPRWHQRVGGWLVFALIKTIFASLRYRCVDRSGYFKDRAAASAIYCVWHNRLALSVPAYQAYARPRTRSAGLAGLVSASKDGGFLAGVLECFGVHPVRGSTSRRGPQALLELTTWAERGYDLAITPDGPRGPACVAQEGVIALAQVTELPILPASYRLGWKFRVRSWDRFQVPLPFSTCEVIFEKPIRVPRHASDAEREALRQQLQDVLREISGD